jgi:hypothetical protein
MKVSEWLRIRDVTDEEFIPMHRIRWFKRWTVKDDGSTEGAREETVWHRDHRIDVIFGCEA